MASSAISRLATVLTLAVSFLTTSAQYNLDKQATNTPSDDTPGWRTDRGRIYIVYGKPDGVTSAYKRDERAETWRYRYIDGLGQDVHIEFVDRCRCGNLLQVTDLEQLKAAQQGVRIIDPLVFRHCSYRSLQRSG